jgi:peptidoglycan/LPS O-acetylase OafA/YrhL
MNATPSQPPDAARPVRAAVAATRHIPSLDGIRAISFLLVFAAHCGLEKLVPGGFGVTVFFFLSGFLITTLMRAEFEANGTVNLEHFWLRRVLRILPPFYLVLLAAIGWTLLFYPPGTLSGMAVSAQLLHFTNYWIAWHGYGGQPAGTGVYWSLAVEEHFYLLFPWLYLAMQRRRMQPHHQALLLWALCILILGWRCVLIFGFHVPADRTYLASDTRIDSILFGCALAVWRNPVLDPWRPNERTYRYCIVPAAFALLVVCLLYRDAWFRETLRYSLQGVALTYIFIAAIRFHDWPIFRALNVRPLAFLGVLSYSLYLVHHPVIFQLQRYFPTLQTAGLAAAALGISLALAWIVYVAVEKPCARLRRKLTDV